MGALSIMARVGHLVPREQQEIVGIVLLLRAYVADHRAKSRRHDTLHRIMLPEAFARVGTSPDCESGAINDDDIWAFVGGVLLSTTLVLAAPSRWRRHPHIN